MTAATLPLSSITPDPSNPRKHFDAGAITELADSIREQGLIQPIVVRPAPAGSQRGLLDAGDYWIVAGERRYRACLELGLAEVDAIVHDALSDDDVAVIQVVENLQRQDLSLSETATGVRLLVDRIGGAKAARQLGKSGGWVSKHATIGELPDEIRALVDAGNLTSADIAHELCRYHDLTAEADREGLAVYNARLNFEAMLDAAADGRLRRTDLRERIESLREGMQRRREQRQAAEEAERQATEAADSAGNDAATAPDNNQGEAQAPSPNAERERIRDILRPYREQIAALQEEIREAFAHARADAVVGNGHGYGGHASTDQLVSTEFDSAANVPPLADLPRSVSITLTVPTLRRALDWLELHCPDASLHLNYTALIGDLATLPDALRRTAPSDDSADPAPADGLAMLDTVLRDDLPPAPGERVKAQHVYDHYVSRCQAAGIQPLALRDGRYAARIVDAGIEKTRIAQGVHYVDRTLARETEAL